MERRKQEKASALGYSAWWLTFDRAALRIPDLLRNNYGISIQHPPILSLDFLSQCLSFGPLRAGVPKAAVQSLPVAIEPRLVQFLTKDLVDEANRIRVEMAGVPERIVTRRVRDFLDETRRRMGPLTERGVSTFFEEIKG